MSYAFVGFDNIPTEAIHRLISKMNLLILDQARTIRIQADDELNNFTDELNKMDSINGAFK